MEKQGARDRIEKSKLECLQEWGMDRRCARVYGKNSNFALFRTQTGFCQRFSLFLLHRRF